MNSLFIRRRRLTLQLFPRTLQTSSGLRFERDPRKRLPILRSGTDKGAPRVHSAGGGFPLIWFPATAGTIRAQREPRHRHDEQLADSVHPARSALAQVSRRVGCGALAVRPSPAAIPAAAPSDRPADAAGYHPLMRGTGRSSGGVQVDRYCLARPGELQSWVGRVICNQASARCSAVQRMRAAALPAPGMSSPAAGPMAAPWPVAWASSAQEKSSVVRA